MHFLSFFVFSNSNEHVLFKKTKGRRKKETKERETKERRRVVNMIDDRERDKKKKGEFLRVELSVRTFTVEVLSRKKRK